MKFFAIGLAIVGALFLCRQKVLLYLNPPVPVPDLPSRHVPVANPYQAFEEAFNCNCAQKYVITPFLKVVKPLRDVRHPDIYSERWVLKDGQNRQVVFENDLKYCNPFSFKKNELVKLAGEMVVEDQKLVIKKSHFLAAGDVTNGYIEYGGKKFCEKL